MFLLLVSSSPSLFYCTFQEHSLTFAFSLPSIILVDILGKSSLLQRVQKLNLFVIGRFRFVLCFSVSRGSLLVIVIMIEGNTQPSP